MNVQIGTHFIEVEAEFSKTILGTKRNYPQEMHCLKETGQLGPVIPSRTASILESLEELLKELSD